jgi:hypothetical protein
MWWNHRSVGLPLLNCCCCLSNRRSSPAPAVSVVLFLSTPPGEIFPELAPRGYSSCFFGTRPPGLFLLPTPRGGFFFPASTYPYPPATPPLLAIRPRHVCHPSTPNLPSGNAIFAIRQRPVCPPATPHLPSGNAILAIRQRQKCHPATPYLPSGNAPSTIRQRHTCHPATPNFDIRHLPICHPATPYLPSVNAIPAIRQRQTCHLSTPYIPSGNSIPASCRFRREGVVGLLSSRARQQAAKPARSRITTPRKPPHHKPPIKDHKPQINFSPKFIFSFTSRATGKNYFIT